MSLFDEEPDKKPVDHVIGGDLSMISVDELTERIGILQQEIIRIEAEIATKHKSKNAAESLFR